MTDTHISLPISKIDAEIADLRKQAQQLSLRADNLEALRQLAISYEDTEKKSGKEKTRRAKAPQASASTRRETGLPYRGMGTKRAAILYLRKMGISQGTTAIAKALIAGGKETTSKAFYRTVFNTLVSASKKKNTELVKIGDQWALKEWALSPVHIGYDAKIAGERPVRK